MLKILCEQRFEDLKINSTFLFKWYGILNKDKLLEVCENPKISDRIELPRVSSSRNSRLSGFPRNYQELPKFSSYTSIYSIYSRRFWKLSLSVKSFIKLTNKYLTLMNPICRWLGNGHPVCDSVVSSIL